MGFWSGVLARIVYGFSLANHGVNWLSNEAYHWTVCVGAVCYITQVGFWSGVLARIVYGFSLANHGSSLANYTHVTSCYLGVI